MIHYAKINLSSLRLLYPVFRHIDEESNQYHPALGEASRVELLAGIYSGVRSGLFIFWNDHDQNDPSEKPKVHTMNKEEGASFTAFPQLYF